MSSARFTVLRASWVVCLVATEGGAILDSCGSDYSTAGQACFMAASDVASGCATLPEGVCVGGGFDGMICISSSADPPDDTLCDAVVDCACSSGICIDENVSHSGRESCPEDFSVCGDDVACGDPHMQGLRGQRIDWSGVNGGWYSLIKDAQADLHINVRLTAPLPDDFADRQLITGVSIMSGGHSLIIEVGNPYTVATEGCPMDLSPCLANGGLRAVVDGDEAHDILGFSRQALIADGQFSVSASNLPAECRQFGGDKIWAHLYEEMLRNDRVLASEQSFEDWILGFHKMAAPGWCTKYIAEHDLAELQSTHAIFKIETSTITVRLNTGVNHQGDGELDWNGRVLPDLEFWQMDVGLDGLDVDSPFLTGILGETARPVYDGNGRAVMEGLEAIRGDVEDYRVAGPEGTHFALLNST